MDLDIRLASSQLARMRAMTGAYHRQFFADTTFSLVGVVVLFLAGWSLVDEAFLLIPIVALTGAVRTAFDASYLMFARWYSQCLEQDLNRAAGRRVLIASEIEAAYLFPLGEPKVVTIPLSRTQTWFSFVTVYYTLSGFAVSAFGIALGWGALMDAPALMAGTYLGGLSVLTVAALAVGWWWFIGGEGERRLQAVIDSRYEALASPTEREDP